ncbi:hypothetical protein COW36_17385 [bacterium (Candidatus Blackallbacteria) CG17_big_fil_post_rev_8_21_14_2_50_48_46]|uniref:Uncharacterized protein n=1 Tax=bacterium (Candidatus Blackallbacteria) CG17_big_fil_post_rev_8_21_14_2_50_48_46 TaxID=2014261 RepID=A0A2M7G0E4_9BACT|nr:MAG: hypothetical protein COW64_01345 [bacterium (Candidatus Blackallbacteria) CG18_big_fil_WC_8_21_14_2_50_49_26]PIW15195.1 MAG: hypothetical protein COW36_17385 [bacterium (Candidatus Blackallbacteria) CG17_big_fil_post_rev_8_21_14_2_50_48_46]PIW44782.1 MAG: hypothetical protein COW20_22720 [bacterium (Candidatus Blackallbacteria) CG13_big_fil_rev_8_21_14_2_50_49_14]
MHRLTRFLVALFALAAVVSPLLPMPVQAEPSKPLGKRGIYGHDSLNAPEEESSAPAEETAEETPEEAEARKKLEAKYPLSITSQTKTSQAAHEAFLAGLKNYYVSKSIFEAANEIKSKYDDKNYILKVEQKGVIQSKLMPQDILSYGPSYAHIPLRVRALGEAQKEISSAITHFSKAASLSPKSKPIKEWLRISKDTLKVFKYHVRFYQITLQNIKRGMTDDQLKLLASRWNSGNPPDMKPSDSLTTRVMLGPMASLLEKQFQAKGETKGESKKMNLDSLQNYLPTMEFKVNKL